jgi:hypothetical protein
VLLDENDSREMVEKFHGDLRGALLHAQLHFQSQG